MNPISTSIGKQVKFILAGTSRFEFQDKCCQYLKLLFPDIVSAAELGDIDSSGIDLFTFDPETERIEKAFQCKGFEVSEFGSSHLSQCKKSITKFIASGLVVDEYYLVVNRYIKKQSYTDALMRLLDEMLASKKAKKAYIFDLNKMVLFFFEKAADRVHELIRNANQRFKNDYQYRMDQSFYQENVNFSLLKQKNVKRDKNPTDYMTKRIFAALGRTSSGAGEAPLKKDALKSFRFFILSEFGFGKTSFLLNMFGKLAPYNLTSIYLPIAQFKKDAFGNEFSLCRNILSILYDKELNASSDYDKFLIKAIQLMIRSRRDLILLLDGLDESSHSYAHDGLTRIFNCFRDFAPICIFSARKEFWDERRGNFETAIGKSRQFSDTLLLTEWSEADIVAYSKTFLRQDKNKGSEQRIKEFITLVNNREYGKYYGDIPKRPLFLKMLIGDIVAGEIKKRRLSQIYETYLKNKFFLDRNTSVSNPIERRPLQLKGDLFKVLPKIFSVLDNIARDMLINDEELNIIFLSYVHEVKLEDAIKKSDIQISDIAEILLNSVLIPFDKRSFSDFRIKFSHKSFQEYFTARFLATLLFFPAGTRSDYDLFHYNFSRGVCNFLVGIILDKKEKVPRETFELFLSMMTDIYKENKNSKSIINTVYPRIANTAHGQASL